ncbi:LOW QUALITY PROTEIN: hypothetical protein BC936DRAFT_137259, partial [Jimgerdemannia flammicorona]
MVLSTSSSKFDDDISVNLDLHPTPLALSKLVPRPEQKTLHPQRKSHQRYPVMDFFSKGYAALLGDKGQPQSPAETIDTLCDRAVNATLLEDRRAAVQGLKGLAQKWKREVGVKGMPALVNILNHDRNDIDTAKAALEAITILCSTDDNVDPNNVTVLLDILEEYDFYVRFNTVKLLTTLLASRSERLQECILIAPMGMSRLIDMLDDRREIVRNGGLCCVVKGLLLLISLTESNADIQKIVAFDNAFERLLAIIDDEEGISGGIIVQDCLQLIHNLLRYNVSNQNCGWSLSVNQSSIHHHSLFQNYFRETSCIQRIPSLLGFVGDSGADHVEYSHEAWPEQKVANTVLVLRLIMILVEPGNQNTKTNQNVMNQCGVLPPVIQLGLCSNAPPSVHTKALHAIADIIRANQANQDYFARTVVASHDQASPPLSALVALIAVSVSAGRPQPEQDPYSVRAAAAYVCESCVAGNSDAQLVLASTLKSPPEDNPNAELGGGCRDCRCVSMNSWVLSLSNDVCECTSHRFCDPQPIHRRTFHIAVGKPFSAGSLLLDALQNLELAAFDPYKVWFACTILANVLRGNERAKQAAANITFGDEENGGFLLHVSMILYMEEVGRQNGLCGIRTNYSCFIVDSSIISPVSGLGLPTFPFEPGEEPVPLLHQVVAQLMMASQNPATNVRVLIGYLTLLSVWLYDSPRSVKQFLSEGVHVQF